MDFGIRELLMLIGALFFIGVLVDGVRRFQANRKKQIKVVVKRKANVVEEDDEEDLDWYSGELPGGKARVKNDTGLELEETSAAYDKKISPRFAEPVDILMEESAPKKVSSDFNDTFDEAQFDNEAYTNDTEVEPQENIERESVASFSASRQGSVNDDLEDEVEGILSAPRVRVRPDSEAAKSREGREEPKKEQGRSRFSAKKASVNQGELFVGDEDDEDSSEPSQDLPEEILAVNVIAKRGEEIAGQDLLTAAQSFGLRFGDMDIFHRHEHSTGQGPVIFSMANAINPGTFEIENLPETNIKGVTFFMRLSEVNKRIFVLELMVDIAKRLANQLGAELKDDTHSVLSSQTVTHYKSRIQEYERRHLGQVLRK